MKRKKTKTAQQTIGRYLKRLRQQKGLSQGEVAKKLHLKSAQTISDWERSYGSIIPMESLYRLLAVYDAPLDEAYDIFVEDHLRRVRGKLDKKRAKLLG